MFARNGKTVLNGEEYARIDFMGERVGIDMLQHPALLVNLKDVPDTESLVKFLNDFVPPYPVFGSMGGGSQMESQAQAAWEKKYGPPPGEPGSRFKIEDGKMVRI